MRTHYLIFGNGLLGSGFATLRHATVLSRAECDITQRDQILAALNYYRPQIVINAAGIVPKANAAIERTFKVNAFAPHYIADCCEPHKCYYIHISTDCVFSGDRGKYTENDTPDATDIYGMSKTLGEPTHALVIRTSFVGLPDPKGRGLLAWAAAQDELTGYDQVYWNGVTVPELVKKVVEFAHERVQGIRHVYSYTLSKYELLRCANDVFGWKKIIYKESDGKGKHHQSDKTLSSVYTTGFVTKPIRQQLEELL